MVKVQGRHGSRWVALQGLYAWQISKRPLAEIEEDLLAGNLHEAPVAYNKVFLHELFQAIHEQSDVLDSLIIPHLDRPLNEVHPVEHAILWMAIYELKDRAETPYKVIINEAILLAKQFGAQDSHKFINGVLDKAAKVLRKSVGAHPVSEGSPQISVNIS